MTTITARVVGALLTFVTVALVGRRIGVQQAGLVLLCWTTVQFLAMVSRLGTHTTLLRLASQAYARGDRRRLRGVALQTGLPALSAAALLAALGVALREQLAAVSQIPRASTVVATFAVGLVPTTGAYLIVEVLKAGRRVEFASLVQTGLTPMLFGAQILVIREPSVTAVARAFLVASVCTLLVSGVLMLKVTGTGKEVSFTDWGALRRSSSLMWLFDASWVGAQWLPVGLAAALLADAQVGVLLTASRFASVPAVLAVGLTNVLAPEFARIALEDDLGRIGHLLRRSAAAALLLSGLLLPLVATFGDELLATAGTGFETGGAALLLLTIGQLIKAATSPSGHALAMLGFEDHLLRNSLVSMAVGVGLMAPAAHVFGTNGAALVMAAAWSIQGLLDVRSVSATTRQSAWPRLTDIGLWEGR